MVVVAGVVVVVAGVVVVVGGDRVPASQARASHCIKLVGST